jgi:hypothetical protein
MLQPFLFLPVRIISNIKYRVGVVICIALFVACNKQTNTTSSEGKIVAKVNNTILYSSDVENLLKNLPSKDSSAYINAYVTKWTDNEVFYQQALNYLTDEELNIDKELEAYKKELISYKFQTKLINDKLDTIITNEQIETYYNANSQSFVLKNNIVKVLYVKTPNNIPNIEKLKKLCYSIIPKDAEQLKIMCVQFANNYYMNDNTWLMFDDLKKEIPQLKEVPDYNLKNGKIFEFTDETSYYFLKIIDIKSKNTLSPINFEKNNIKNMLINQRKQQLISTIKKDFFDKAKTNKELEIYN